MENELTSIPILPGLTMTQVPPTTGGVLGTTANVSGALPKNSQSSSNAKSIFDGKRMRKPIQRKTVDYNSVMMKYVERRKIFKQGEYLFIQPDAEYIKELMPPITYPVQSSICTKFVHTSTNKVRCPINVVRWTPEGRRLITGSSSGEFTLWNGLTFNFETILQAHDSAIRAMIWSHNHNWMITGDHGGNIKYWQPSMNNVKAFSAHKEAVRDLAFAPTDLKIASCSDDVSVKIWDFAMCKEEFTLTGHGWDVKCVNWHPQKSLLVSGSKDNLIKLWDVKAGKNITTLHGHKNTILKVKWNQNGNWLLSASRDQLLKLFDLRTMKELQTFRGHKREVTACSWHPYHETLFASGGYDGQILFWNVGSDESQGDIGAHEASIWDLDWHPVGHILCSGSNDHTTKFWCRNRPNDKINDRYNVQNKNMHNSESQEEDQKPSFKDQVIPGMNLPDLPGMSSASQNLTPSFEEAPPPSSSSIPTSSRPAAIPQPNIPNLQPRDITPPSLRQNRGPPGGPGHPHAGGPGQGRSQGPGHQGGHRQGHLPPPMNFHSNAPRHPRGPPPPFQPPHHPGPMHAPLNFHPPHGGPPHPSSHYPPHFPPNYRQ